MRWKTPAWRKYSDLVMRDCGEIASADVLSAMVRGARDTVLGSELSMCVCLVTSAALCGYGLGSAALRHSG